MTPESHEPFAFCSFQETLVGAAEDDQLVPGPHAARLQRAQQREGALPEDVESDDRLVVLSVDEADFAVTAPGVREQVGQRIVKLHAGYGGGWKNVAQ